MTAVAPPGWQDRAAYLTDLCELLWPAPALVTWAAERPADAGCRAGELIVLPGSGRPRLVVPSGRRASAAAVSAHGEAGSAGTRLAARALGMLLTCGLGMVARDRLRVHVPAGAQTIESYLSGLLGQRVDVAFRIGAPRANRKPVLRLLTLAGDTLGFAKVGINPLTTRLVRAERAALDLVNAAGLASVRVPTVLGGGRWRDLEVLVVSPLPASTGRVPLRPGQLASAVAELAAVTGIRRAPLADSDYWRRLARRLDAAAEGSEHAALRTALDRLASRAGDTVIDFGACHGDLTPWNLASTRCGLLVWDWERFEGGTPIGFDVLHYWLQAQVATVRRDPERAAVRCVDAAPELLGRLAVQPAPARVTALAYLADLSARYLADRQAEAGARLGAPGRWLIPALTAGIGRL